MRKPPWRQRLTWPFTGRRFGPEYWPWLETQVDPRRQLRVLLVTFGALAVLGPGLEVATGTVEPTTFVAPSFYVFAVLVQVRRSRSPESIARMRWKAGLPPYDQVAPPRSPLEPFGPLGAVVFVAAATVLVAAVTVAVEETTADDRCRDVPAEGLQLLQRSLLQEAPPQLVVTDPLSGRHPQVVGARRVEALFPDSDYYVAAFVRIDGGEVRGPAVWRVVDTRGYGPTPPGFPKGLQLSAWSPAAHALTPLVGYGQNSDPRSAAALECVDRR